MTTTTEELMWGRSAAPRLELVGGFALLVAGTLIAMALTNVLAAEHPLRRVLHDIGLPLVLFYAPGGVTAIGGYLRCGATTCFVVGVLPATAFAVAATVGAVLGVPGVGGGDAPLWSITLAFAAISLVFATIGFTAGTGVRFIETRIRQGTSGPRDR